MSISTIQHLGYSEKESRVYLALLELGSSPASTVARFLSENRVTTYSILKILIKKGIIFESKKHNIQIYTALSPELLIEKEKNKYEQLRESLPSLLALMNPHAKKPKVTFYDGIDGLKTLLRALIQDFQKDPTMELYGFLGAKEMDNEFEIFLRTALEIDKQKPPETPTHVILVGDHDYWYANYCRDHYMTKTVEEGTVAMEHEIFTYENKVVILMYHPQEVSGVIIESLSLANGIRSMFDLIWKYAPDIREKI
jgi:HTH-type transcriptional regulator, sugar sensing transcriptional regulator